MKKMTLLLLMLLLSLTLAACRIKEPAPISPVDEPPVTEQTPTDTEQPPESEDEQENLQTRDPSGPDIYAVSPAVLARMESAVSGFRILPQEFTSVSELSDTTLFFAGACTALPNFIPSSDGYTFTLSLAELEAAIQSIFGPEAVLSENFRNNNYAPFYLDGDTVYCDSLGTPQVFPYSLSVTSLGDGRWEFRELILSDPLFWNEGSNAEFLESGGTVSWDMVAPYVDELTTYIYILKEVGTGYMIESFSCINYRESGSVSY